MALQRRHVEPSPDTAELATLVELDRVRRHIDRFPLTAALPIDAALFDLAAEWVVRGTLGGLRLWQQLPEPRAFPAAYDRLVEMRYANRPYGLLGAQTGYLQSAIIPDALEELAFQCAALLHRAAEHALLVGPTHRLPPVAGTPHLTPRQAELVLALARGETEAETCTRLRISATTVRTLRQQVYVALGVSNPRDAVVRAYEYGLINVLAAPPA